MLSTKIRRAAVGVAAAAVTLLALPSTSTAAPSHSDLYGHLGTAAYGHMLSDPVDIPAANESDLPAGWGTPAVDDYIPLPVAPAKKARPAKLKGKQYKAHGVRLGFLTKKYAAFASKASKLPKKCKASSTDCAVYTYNSKTGKLTVGNVKGKVTKKGTIVLHRGGEKVTLQQVTGPQPLIGTGWSVPTMEN